MKNFDYEIMEIINLPLPVFHKFLFPRLACSILIYLCISSLHLHYKLSPIKFEPFRLNMKYEVRGGNHPDMNPMYNRNNEYMMGHPYHNNEGNNEVIQFLIHVGCTI